MNGTGIALVLALAIFCTATGMADAAGYMYEKASVQGVGYKNAEMIISTQYGYEGGKLVSKQSGSGNIITDRIEIEAERQLQHGYLQNGGCTYPTGNACPMDYINITQEGEFEYMPVSYQTGTYDQKWMEKLCLQNYRIGAVLTEMYTHAEHLQKSTVAKSRGYGWREAQKHEPQIIYGTGDRFYAKSGFDPNSPDYELTSPVRTDEFSLPYVVGLDGTNNDELVNTGMAVSIGDPSPDDSPPAPPDPPNPPDPPESPDPGVPPDPPEPPAELSREVVMPGYTEPGGEALCATCCTGVLEANLNSNVIGVAHIGWISRDPTEEKNLDGRHAEYGRSVEDLTGVFSIEKFIQLWGNSTCGAISVDWLPCV